MARRRRVRGPRVPQLRSRRPPRRIGVPPVLKDSRRPQPACCRRHRTRLVPRRPRVVAHHRPRPRRHPAESRMGNATKSRFHTDAIPLMSQPMQGIIWVASHLVVVGCLSLRRTRRHRRERSARRARRRTHGVGRIVGQGSEAYRRRPGGAGGDRRRAQERAARRDGGRRGRLRPPADHGQSRALRERGRRRQGRARHDRRHRRSPGACRCASARALDSRAHPVRRLRR